MERQISKPKTDVFVVALVKGEENYVWIFDKLNASAALRSMGRFASNPELSLTWYDCAMLSQKLRKEIGA